MAKAEHIPRVTNLRLAKMPPSATLAINEQSNKLVAEGRKVYKFGLGQSPFPVPDCMVRELQARAHEKDYLDVRGLLQLRTAVADFHNRVFPPLNNVAHTADSVLIGPGSKELLFLLQLSYYGELVLPAPSWVSYGPQAQLIGRPLTWLTTRDTTGWKVTPAALQRMCRAAPDVPRLLVLNYPSNPTGAVYTRDELAALADVLREHRVLVLSDEIYGMLTFDGEPSSLSEFYPEGTIVLGGASKWLGAGGWRVGYFMFPEQLRWLRNAMAAAASETFTAVAAPLQYAVVPGFEDRPEIHQYLARSRRVLKLVAGHTCEVLRGAGVSVVNPDGGFYVWVNFGDTPRYRDHPLRALFTEDDELETLTSQAMVEEILNETGVAMLAGTHFGVADAYVLCGRMAFVDFDGTKALAAIDDVPTDATHASDDGATFLREFCPNIVEGLDRLASFLSTPVK